MKKQYLWNIVILVVVLAGLARWWFSHQSAEGYNSYLSQIRPILALQDAVIQDISKSSDAHAATMVAAWIKRSESHKAKLVTIRPQHPEIAAMHKQWLLRTDHITQGLKALQQYFVAKNPAFLKQYQDEFKKAKIALDLYIKMRDEHFKKHNIKLKKE